jgi:hypothetical protein
MMALPLATIAKLIGQLTVLVPAADTLLRTLRGTVSQIPDNPSATEHLDDIERALTLQLEVTENLTTQLRTVQSALAKIERSLKVLTFGLIGAVALAILAIIMAAQ